jgi:hypothetical protein
LLWINGKAGSGKSTVTKFIVQDPRTQDGLNQARPDTLILSHFLWRGGQLLEKSIKGLLCCLLHQLLAENPTLAAYALETFSYISSKHFVGDWSSEELENILLSLLASHPNPICIFIDGLDEIDPSDGQFEVLELVKTCITFCPLKLCVTSRPEPVLRGFLERFPHLRVQDLSWEAMIEYATAFLRPYFGRDTAERKKFAAAVCDRADGVFLWVALALKRIRIVLCKRQPQGAMGPTKFMPQ